MHMCCGYRVVCVSVSMKRPLSPSFDSDVLMERAEIRPTTKRGRPVVVRKASWNTIEGLSNVMRVFKESRFDPLDKMLNIAWWKQNASAKCKIPIICSECGYRPPACGLDNFSRTGNADCFCNGGARWNGKEGHDRFLKLIEASSRFVALEFTKSFDWWKQQNVTVFSCIPFKCIECNSVVDSTNVQHFSREGQGRCGCRWKTQALASAFASGVCSNASDTNVYTEFKLEKGHVRYDIAIVKSRTCVLLIEIDGDQHFGDIGVFGDSSRTRDHDVSKENSALEREIPIVRMYQPDVWSGRFDWKPYLKKKIFQALAGKLLPRVYCQPDCLLYTTGVYAELRKV